METKQTLKEQIADLNKQIKELENKRSVLESQVNKLEVERLEGEYPEPAEYSWEYIFSVPHYVLTMTKGREKKYYAFTGRWEWIYPALCDGSYKKGPTGLEHQTALQIYLHNVHDRYPTVDRTIEALEPIVAGAQKNGLNHYALSGSSLEEGLCLRLHKGKWYIETERWLKSFEDEPSYPKWTGDSWQEGVKAYSLMEEKHCDC